MRRCPSSFTQCIFVSTRLRLWYPLQFRQMARPRYFEARRASFLATAPAVTVFRGLAFFAGWDNGIRPTVSDGIVAFASIIGTVCGDAADRLVRRDLVQQIGRHWRIHARSVAEDDAVLLEVAQATQAR